MNLKRITIILFILVLTGCSVSENIDDTEPDVTQATLDILQAMDSYHFSTQRNSEEVEDVVEIMTSLLNANKDLEQGNAQIEGYINSPNEIISTSAQGMKLGAMMVAKANDDLIQFLRSTELNDSDISTELQYVMAKHISDQKEGYMMIAISAPQITSLIFEPAISENPTGEIPYTISKEERKRIINEILRLFKDDLEQYWTDIGNETGDYNAIIFSVDGIYQNVFADTYEETSSAEKNNSTEEETTSTNETLPTSDEFIPLVKNGVENGSDFSINADMSCIPITGALCSNGQCEDRIPKVWIDIDTLNKTAARCDTAGCDVYDIQFSQSGIFMNISRPYADGWDVRINTLDGSYTETATLLLDQYISYGACINI